MGSLKTVTTLLLARHGQSTWNAVGRWQGQADPPLSELGRDQAIAAARRIGTVDLIYSSPQIRALTSASLIGSQIGVGPVVVVADLRERGAGPWSGLTRAEIEAEWPGWVESGERPDGYEEEDTLNERVSTALTQIVADSEGATVLVMCHGGVIRSFELAIGDADGRVPNLSGRIVSATTSPQSKHPSWALGERLELLDPDLSTGGERNGL